MQGDNSQTTLILIIGVIASTITSIFAIVKTAMDRRTDERRATVQREADEKKALQQREWDLEDRRENNAKLLAATDTVAVEVKKATVIADEKREILASVVEINASEILHHANQPVFDILIDRFKDHEKMTNQEMIQFIQRLEIIANDTREKTPQQPAARLMLDRALNVARGRNLKVATRAELGENRAAGEAMRVEAEPQKGKHDDGEKGESKEGKLPVPAPVSVPAPVPVPATPAASSTIEAVRVALTNPDAIEAVTVEIHADEVTVETPRKKERK